METTMPAPDPDRDLPDPGHERPDPDEVDMRTVAHHEDLGEWLEAIYHASDEDLPGVIADMRAACRMAMHSNARAMRIGRGDH
jgi:hypothetical protein